MIKSIPYLQMNKRKLILKMYNSILSIRTTQQ